MIEYDNPLLQISASYINIFYLCFLNHTLMVNHLRTISIVYKGQYAYFQVYNYSIIHLISA